MLTLQLSNDEENDKIVTCPGSIYRGNVYNGITNRGFSIMKRLNKQKRLSCPGCEGCGWQDTILLEVDDKNFPLLGLENINHGQLYKIELIQKIPADGREIDPEDYFLRLKEYKKENNV
jgi:hypothetical protein